MRRWEGMRMRNSLRPQKISQPWLVRRFMKVLSSLLAGENTSPTLDWNSEPLPRSWFPSFFPTHPMVIFQRIIKEEVYDFFQIAVKKMETLVIQIREKFSNLTILTRLRYLVETTSKTNEHPQNLCSRRIIANVSCSTLFIHGEADSLIPPEHSLKLFKSLGDKSIDSSISWESKGTPPNATPGK